MHGNCLTQNPDEKDDHYFSDSYSRLRLCSRTKRCLGAGKSDGYRDEFVISR